MPEDTSLYNSRLIKNYTDYLAKYYPDVDIKALLTYAGMTPLELEDGGHWFSQEQVTRFHEILTRTTSNPNIAREVGRFTSSSEAFGSLRQYVMGFLSAPLAYTLFEKIAATVTRATTFSIKKVGAHKIEVLSTLKEGVKEHPNQCENRLGMLEALAKVYTRKLATIEHATCINRGGAYCRYIVSWETTPSYRWRIISRYSSVLSLLIFFPLIFFLSPTVWAEIILLPTILNLGLFLYTKDLEKKEIIQNILVESDAANLLVDQINIRYNEAKLVQEIGQATSMILDINDLLKFVMEALEKRLDFNRGMIMLANRGKTRLSFMVGYGYLPEQERYLQTLEFHLDNPQSKGVAVEAFRKQETYLINDVTEIAKNISSRSLEFIHRLEIQSFICVPIVYKDESMGILFVDTPKAKRKLGQSDRNLLMGIAPQIAISINNAISYQKIQESEERFRSLSVNSPDIIYTLGTDGAFAYVNPAWERILGHPAEEVIGRYFVDFVHPEDIPFYRTIFKRTRDGRDTVRDLTGTILHQNGSERYFSISAAPNLDVEGAFLGVVGTFKDITDRKYAEDALQYRVEFEKLITSISTHFINVALENIRPEINQALKRIGSFAGVDRSYIFRFQDQGNKADNIYEWCASGIPP